MLKVPGRVTERRNLCALLSEVGHTAGPVSATQPFSVSSLSDWPFLRFALSSLDPEETFEASKDGRGQPWCYSLLHKGSVLFHVPALWGSSLCLPAPAPLSVPAVSVSFHSLQGAGLHCSYEHRLGRLGPKSNSSKKPQVGLLSLSVSRLPLQSPSITVSASYLLLTVSTQFHVQATNAVLIHHSSAWGLWLRASGQLTSTVHSS